MSDSALNVKFYWNLSCCNVALQVETCYDACYGPSYNMLHEVATSLSLCNILPQLATLVVLRTVLPSNLHCNIVA